MDKEKSSLTFPAGDNKIRRKEIHCALKAFDNLSAETVTLEDDKKVSSCPSRPRAVASLLMQPVGGLALSQYAELWSL